MPPMDAPTIATRARSPPETAGVTGRGSSNNALQAVSDVDNNPAAFSPQG